MARRGALVTAAAAGCGASLLLFTMMTMMPGRGLNRAAASRRSGMAATTTELAEQPEVVYLPGGALEAQAHLKAHYQGKEIEFMPVTSLKKAGVMIPASISTILADNATNGTDAGNGTDAAGGGGGESIYFTADASCAISNLVSRAKQIIPNFELCGYMDPDQFEAELFDEEGGKEEAPSCANLKRSACKALSHCAYDSSCGCHSATCACGACPVPGQEAAAADGAAVRAANQTNTISPPSDYDGCTRERMYKSKCRKRWVRHYMNKTTTSLSNCLMRVKGLSQTCDLYDACGPPSSFKPTLLSHTSVCSAPEGYYNEEYVERFCGICEMFRASTPWLAMSPSTEKPPWWTFQEGCFATSGEVALSSGERTTIGGLRIGDEVEGGGRVYFEHSHPEAMSTVVLSGGGASIELTGGHIVYIADGGKGERMVPAASVRRGDLLLGPGGEKIAVVGVEKSVATVRYVLTSKGRISVGGVVASVCSSPLCPLEVAPFYFLDAILPGVLQWGPVAAAIRLVLESPILKWITKSLPKQMETRVTVDSARGGSLWGRGPMGHENVFDARSGVLQAVHVSAMSPV